MKIAGLVWLEPILEKLWRKHHVDEGEVEQVLESRSRFRFVEKGHRPGEDVYAALGRTDAGRYLIVFFVYRSDTQAVIISAREMTPAERKRYEQK